MVIVYKFYVITFIQRRINVDVVSWRLYKAITWVDVHATLYKHHVPAW